MNKNIYNFGLLLIFVTNSFAEDPNKKLSTRIFFRWLNNWETRDIYEDPLGQKMEQIPTGNIPLNKNAFTRYRERYIRENLKHRIGPGYYISASPFDSAQYGADLVLFEITTPNPDEFSEHRADFKEKNIEALKTNGFYELPAFQRYTKDPNIFR